MSKIGPLSFVTLVTLCIHSLPPREIFGEDLEFKAFFTQDEFLVGELVLLHVSVANVGSKDIYGVGDLTPESNSLKIVVHDPSGETREYPTFIIEDMVFRWKLKPGESMTKDVDLRVTRARDSGWALMFPTPGAYVVNVEWTGRGSLVEKGARGTIEVAPVRVEIRIVGAENEPGADLFADPNLWFADGYGLTEPIVQKLQSLSEMEGERPFQIYARYLLGFRESILNNLDKAAKLLASADREGFQLRDMALVKLAEIYDALNELPAAEECANKAIEVTRIQDVKNRAVNVLGSVSHKRTHGLPERPPPPPEKIPADPAELQAVLDLFLAAWSRRDLEATLSFLASAPNFMKEDRRYALEERVRLVCETPPVDLRATEVEFRHNENGVPLLEFKFEAYRDGKLLSNPEPSAAGFVKEDGRWLIAGWTWTAWK